MLPALHTDDQAAFGTGAGACAGQLPLACHARSLGAALGPDQIPEHGAHTQAGNDGHTEKKNDNLHDRLRWDRNFHYHAAVLHAGLSALRYPVLVAWKTGGTR
jgi:hypothetical protein